MASPTSDNTTTATNGTTGVEQYQEATGLRIFRLTFFSMIILASLIGNSVICKAVWSMPFRKPFSYHLVANMAFAEILNSICFPVMLVEQFEMDSIEYSDHNTVIDIWCIATPLQVFSLMVVTYSLASLAFYRYRVLVNPASRGPSWKEKTLIFSCLWLLPAAICVPLFLAFKFENGHCVVQSQWENNLTYIYVKFILNFAVPYFVMLASYGAVACSLRERISQKTEQARNSIIPSSITVDIEAEEPMELRAVTNNQEEERKLQEDDQRRQVLVDVNDRRFSKPENADIEKDLLKMIFVLILIFVICYFPYQAVFLWERIADVQEWKFRYHDLMRRYNFILTCLPSALHPVCYGTMNRFYAKAFSDIFLCKC